MKILYLIMLFYLFITSSEIMAQNDYFEIKKLKIDADYTYYFSNMQMNESIRLNLNSHTVLVIVDSQIPNLCFISDIVNGIIRMRKISATKWEMFLIPGVHQLKLSARGFIDTTLRKRKFEIGKTYSLRATINGLQEGYCYLKFLINPDSSEIEINNKLVPIKTPFGCQVPKGGKINIAIIHPEYKCITFDTTMTLKSNYHDLIYHFPPIKPKGYLSFNIMPPSANDAYVYVKKEKMNHYDLIGNAAKIAKLDTGLYTVSIRKTDFYDKIEPYVCILACDTINKYIELKKRTNTKHSSPKIAVRVIKKPPNTPLDDSELNKIKTHIFQHYQNCQKLHLIPESEADSIFKKIKNDKELLNLKQENKIVCILDCETSMLFKEEEKPEESVIKIVMKLNMLRKEIERDSIIIISSLKEYFPTKIDSGLAEIDKMCARKKCQLFDGKWWLFCPETWIKIGWATTWIVLWMKACKSKSQKLPDAPPLPKPPDS